MFDLLSGMSALEESFAPDESALHMRGLFVFTEVIMEHGNARNAAKTKRKRRRNAEPANLNDRQRVEWQAAHPRRGDILSCFSQRNGVSGL